MCSEELVLKRRRHSYFCAWPYWICISRSFPFKRKSYGRRVFKWMTQQDLLTLALVKLLAFAPLFNLLTRTRTWTLSELFVCTCHCFQTDKVKQDKMNLDKLYIIWGVLVNRLTPKKACLKLFCALNGCNLLLGEAPQRTESVWSKGEDFFHTY